MKPMEQQYSLYKRGEVWWAKVGRGEMKPLRFSCRTSDRDKAEELAARTREQVLHQTRSRIALESMAKTENADAWREFVASEDGARLAQRLERNARLRARARGLTYALTVNSIRALLALSEGRCSVCGLQLLRAGPARDPMQASIDRIDNAAGYEVGNVRVVALGVNLAMNIWGAQRFMELALGTAAAWMARTVTQNRLQSDR